MIEIIEAQSDLNAAADKLTAIAPEFAPVLDQTGQLPLRRRAGGFAGLVRILVGQQVSVAAADAIWARVESAGFDSASAWGDAADEDIAACGLSKPKVRYGRALVDANINFDTLNAMDDASVLKHLTAVKGIGPWSAQIYLMSALGRMDVMPAADLALQEAAKIMLGLDTRPKAAELEQIAARWSPYRSVAARALWTYYRLHKGRKGTL